MFWTICWTNFDHSSTKISWSSGGQWPHSLLVLQAKCEILTPQHHCRTIDMYSMKTWTNSGLASTYPLSSMGKQTLATRSGSPVWSTDNILWAMFSMNHVPSWTYSHRLQNVSSLFPVLWTQSVQKSNNGFFTFLFRHVLKSALDPRIFKNN